MQAIVVEQLVKAYRNGFRVVDDVSFVVGVGQVFGFLGPNGAGKSTTVQMLTTLCQPSSGRAFVGGYDVVRQADAVRRTAGVALQDVGIDPYMTAPELLVLQCRLFGSSNKQARQRAIELLQLVKLDSVAARPVGQYSGGMRRRLDLALALAHEPAILFLDEPTTGLDPASRRDIWTEVRRLNRERGMTIFLTTQYLEEADELADNTTIIHRGKIVAEGQPEALKAAFGSESITLTFAGAAVAQRAEQRLAARASATHTDRQVLRLYLPHAARAVPGIIADLGEIGVEPLALTLARPTLDDVFLRVTGQQLSTDVQAPVST